MKLNKVLSTSLFVLMGLGVIGAITPTSVQAHEHFSVSSGRGYYHGGGYYGGGSYYNRGYGFYAPSTVVTTYSDPVYVDSYPSYYSSSPYYYNSYPARSYGYYARPGVSLNFGFGGHRHWR